MHELLQEERAYSAHIEDEKQTSYTTGQALRKEREQPMSAETIVYRQRVTFCGKANCRRCQAGQGHGPYWYAYQTINGQTRQRYVGKTLPAGIREEASTPAALVRLYVLGQVRLERRTTRGGNEEGGWYPVRDSTWNAPVRPLLGVLASSKERRVSIAHIRELLGSKASASDVQRAIERLRSVLEPPRRANQSHVLATRLVEASADSLGLVDQTRLWIDADAFESLISQAREADTLDERERLLEEALTLYGGDYWPAASERETSWILPRRQILRRQWLTLLLDLADVRGGSGNEEGAIRLLDQLLAADPTNEAAIQRLLLLLAQSGHRAEALRLYQRFTDALGQEAPVMPTADTRALYEAIQSGQTPQRLPLSTERLTPLLELKPRSVTQVGRSNQSHLVGRKHELAVLHQLVLNAEQQRQLGQCAIVLTGEAGIGKTRLVEELARSTAQRGWMVAWGRAYAQEGTIPYHLWTEAVRRAMRHGPALRQELARRPFLYQPLLALLPDLEDLFPAGSATLAPEQEPSRLLWEAIRALLLALSEQRPLLIVLDDMQWADLSSCELLAYLVRQLHDSSILIAATCRDSELPPAHPLRAILRDFQREQALELMAVPPLTDEQIRALVSTLPEPVVRDIQVRAAGNPFFAEELARSAAGAPPNRLTALPDSVAAVLDVRLSRVSDACQRVLGRAAVLGGSFDFSTLCAVESGPGALQEDHLLDLVEEALRAGILIEEEHGAHTTYSFWHPLAVDHLYRQISAVRRASLHLRVADALQVRFTGREHQGAASIVHHLMRGGSEPGRIAHFAEVAGDQAYLLSAYPEAAHFYRLAVEHLMPSHADPSRLAERVRLSNVLERLGECERVQGHDREACDAYERALRLRPTPSRTREDAQLAALLWIEIGKTWYDRRVHDQARHCYRQAEETLQGAGIENGAAWASLFLQEGYAFWQEGEVEQARQAASRALHLFEDLQPTPPEQTEGNDRLRTAAQRTLLGDPIDPGRAHLLLGTLAAVMGEREALHHLQQALIIFERYDRPREIAMICCNLGDYYMRQADLSSAQAALRRSLNTAERIGDVPLLSVSAGNLGLIAARVGDLQEAERFTTRAVMLAEQMHDPFYASLWQSYLAAVLLDQGKIEQAKTLLCQALKAGRAIQSAPCVAVALIVLGQLRLALALQHSEAGPFLNKAARSLRRALALGDLEAETRFEGQLVLARIAWLQGHQEAQQETQQVFDGAQREALLSIQASAQRQLGTMLATPSKRQPGESTEQASADRWNQGESLFQAALATFKRLGMRLEYARTVRDYGIALLQRDDLQGFSMLNEARGLFAARQAVLDLDQVEQALSALRGAEAPPT